MLQCLQCFLKNISLHINNKENVICLLSNICKRKIPFLSKASFANHVLRYHSKYEQSIELNSIEPTNNQSVTVSHSAPVEQIEGSLFKYYR